MTSLQKIADYFATRRTKKAKRADNAAFIAKMKGGRPPSVRERVIAQLDKLWSLVVRVRDIARYGSVCRICRLAPIQCGYHLVPKQRGFSVRWLLENGVGACNACNDGEHWNRSLYRDKHIALFGRELIETLEAKARIKVHFTVADLVEMRDRFRALLARPASCWGSAC